MGNYKSRPLTSCSDELKKKISEGYSVVRSRLSDDVRSRSNLGWVDVQIAAFEKSLEDFKQHMCPENAELKSTQLLSLFHIICAGHSDSQPEKLQFLIDNLPKESSITLISSQSANGFTPLHIAIYRGDVAILKALIATKLVDLDQSGRHLLPALHLAAMIGDSEMLTILLNSGANIHVTDFVHFTALHCATYFGQENAVRTLISASANLNLGGAVNDRPIHLAAAKGLTSITKLLLEAKADPLLADDEGNQALHYAAKSGSLVILNMLIKQVRGTNDRICARNLYGDTALHLSCYSGRLDIVKSILDSSPTNIVNMENVFSETPLHAACTGGKSIELVSFLMKYPGVDPNYQGQDGHTALHSACYHGHLRIVQYLLENGADQSLASRAFEGGALRQQAGPGTNRPSKVASAIMALNRSDTPSSNASYNSTVSLDDQQTPVIWAYERGHDAIVALLKHYAARTVEGDVCSEYSSGESSYTPLPSPMGRLTSLTRDKADLLQLRSALPAPFHLCLAEIEFQESIGSGSFGKVYKGTYRGKLVAVKRYRAMAFGCKSETDMLCREVSILSRLAHPNVVAFVGTSLDDPSQFAIITEFVENGSLFRLLHEEKRVMDPAFRLRISLDVARGMRYLHESAAKPVIHRDLNSHNILIHADGRSVVADFGESRFVCQREDENLTKQPGNLRWMAPEVFSQSGKYDRKVDVFSFALVIWEIHTAELPFSHLKPAAAAAEMTYKRGRPTLPNQPTAQFPAHILSLIPQAWHPESSSRPDFVEIVALLEPHVESTHTDISAPSTVSQLTSQWEQLSVAPPPASKFPPILSALHGIAATGTVEELRQRIDNNGYVINKS
ncbi:Protein kinase domain-containing protein [Caenorhabditis elegans]|uniref:Protein kinase domain-containing protein n=1 Tax=Caenorhabditis elegans TaxID=6239 RepID=A0A679L8N8_CAEEL|nr:Suppressor/Enhancer of Lin-12 [Caenorhabditis elegans]CAA9991427.1 Suppressor/Enhancer of Lin-12 [Caenorhabditis elegans]